MATKEPVATDSLAPPRPAGHRLLGAAPPWWAPRTRCLGTPRRFDRGSSSVSPTRHALGTPRCSLTALAHGARSRRSLTALARLACVTCRVGVFTSGGIRPTLGLRRLRTSSIASPVRIFSWSRPTLGLRPPGHRLRTGGATSSSLTGGLGSGTRIHGRGGSD